MTTTREINPLDAGDIVWLDLRPTLGREQSGVRPAVVLTDADFHSRHATAIICPITSNVRPWPSKVVLPEGVAVTGAVLADQIRSVDRASRGFRRVGSVPPVVMTEIRNRVMLLIGGSFDAAGSKGET
ncbi:type II toxin-antitoxin system PemK/MazF family toxin [Methylobacterium sp. NEAU 140]|uniref:type II toxin-antitoxin system PemK/MazF family toxin n=1 Tax=Methylobacterium sp. NEAU 140 TaxID=3064945 RepID=UPI002734601A|nr:type II toxin-antitoxin system PemK/MazF family toxin [Methylobacterium sp. NEAU 140]MDP4023908.1 type II toxin-antitoxin system PemK/MazF family toxin [Methylobacterium sp. NEAU 140]